MTRAESDNSLKRRGLRAASERGRRQRTPAAAVADVRELRFPLARRKEGAAG